MPRDMPDCQACGACCISTYDDSTFVDLERRDVLRLSQHYRSRYVVQDALATKRTTDGVVCVGLGGRIGQRCHCLIYESRPDACRSFKPGTRDCKAARREAGLY